MNGGRPDSDIQRLVSAARAGDRDAFAELYRRFAPRVTAILRRQFRDQTEDVIHDAFLKAFIKIDSFAFGKDRSRMEVEFMNWIVSIGRNEGISANRRRRPRTGVDLSQSATNIDPSEALEREEQKGILDGCLTELDETARALIESQYGGDEEHSMVCKRLRITVEQGYKARHNALQRLRECANRKKR